MCYILELFQRLNIKESISNKVLCGGNPQETPSVTSLSSGKQVLAKQ